jgi:hypothetical protein
MRRIANCLTIFFVFVCSFVAFAQDDIPDYDPSIPVDGGIGVLLVAGALWGVKKLKS